MALRRPSFLPSLDELENQVEAQAAAQAPSKSAYFDHPIAKNIFWISLILVIVSHLVALSLFFFVD
ncbi:hypothetical protein BTM25_00460 [Actinomadura rubteroloni]|uniref:Uncharacterized protein n=1 Tax=Actinomadura rubteroloni TaxID=1926885 RepID=A0A2P4UKT2_9ACTN|nr:hypothetical protein [Actinomadura rubteroloni]POM25664.1 hypothetical protein BTM25_00460 [Actinomadura rubteroloni]